MRDPLDINLEKAKFNMVVTPQEGGNGTLDLIRWGYFDGNDNKPRVAAFRISMNEAQSAHMGGKDIIVESNKVAQSSKAKDGAIHQAYEWEDNSFIAVNPVEQDWFEFL